MQRTTRAATRVAPIAADKEEEVLREALRRAQRSTTSPVDDARIENLSRDLFVTKRRGATRQVLAIARDAFQRGAAQCDLEAFGQRYIAAVRAWFRYRDGDTLPRFEVAHEREEAAQGARELAETRFCHDRSPAAARAFLDADTAYLIADEQLREIAEDTMLPRPALAVVGGGAR